MAKGREKISISNNLIVNEEGGIVAILCEEATSEIIDDLMKGYKLVPAVRSFVKDANKGKFKPRTTIKKFEELINEQ